MKFPRAGAELRINRLAGDSFGAFDGVALAANLLPEADDLAVTAVNNSARPNWWDSVGLSFPALRTEADP